MRSILFILGLIIFAAAVFGGLYVSIMLCLVGGIIQLVQAFQHTPLDAAQIAYGVVRILLTSVAGGLTFAIGSFIAAIFFGTSSVYRTPRRRW